MAITDNLISVSFQGFERYLSRVWREKYKLLKCILQLSLIPSQRNVENFKNIILAPQNVNKLHRAVLPLSQGGYHTSVSVCHSQPDLPCITSHRPLVPCALEVVPVLASPPSCVPSLNSPWSSWQSGCAVSAGPGRVGSSPRSLCDSAGTTPCCG